MNPIKKLDLTQFYESQGFAVGDHDYAIEDRFSKIVKIINNHISRNGESAPHRLLDIGCGDASFLSYLAVLFPELRLAGSDVAVNIVKLNKQKFINMDFFNHDFNKVITHEEKFDIIIAGEIIEHLENTDIFLESLQALLAPGGIIILTTPNLASWLDRIMLLIGWQPFSTEVSYASRTFGRKKFYAIFGITESPAVGHLRLFTPGALYDLTKYYGFKMIEHFPYHQQPFLINVQISKYFKNFAEGIILVLSHDK
jgi:2-polyprenyl-3-methyl-5-hydroxy-6-metoxy-1,4-benzoquinol methylase